ncbi:hepatic sodium/bile acid cotransporter-like [Musca vetustissima]|uniref:hepatic sodium/bile acid cotransporter-like n=1 Tax=Musca vetustissima TaxID=27455 RepID=UPI002AB6254B|nr:hepatic sodium/bile acid cotransporter-like [Musca vetustissima]
MGLSANVTENPTINYSEDTEDNMNFTKVPLWTVKFEEKLLNMSMGDIRTVEYEITNIDPLWGEDYEFHVVNMDHHLLRLSNNIIKIAAGQTSWRGNFTVEAILLGRSEIYVELHRLSGGVDEIETSLESLDVMVLRSIGTMDIVFQVLVGCFVMVLYVNFGAVLELDALKRILVKPIGPAIGFVGQFMVMPILSFLIGYYLFHDMIELRLGLFFTGSTPGGGASNIFTVILNGNLNLSITMTAISNLAAFGMMPIWIFTLGALIFKDGHLAVPYKTIAAMSFSLVLPLAIGLALQKYAPTVAKKMSKITKPFAIMFIIVITGFAFTTNSYMFKLFSWKILVASSALPWIGYLIGYLMAIVCRQSPRDALTIAIETGIQNTGIAIFMLNFTLPQPQADMTSAVPVANSMMTPLPLILIYLIRKIFCRTSIEEVEEAPTKEAKIIEVEAIMEKGEHQQKFGRK